MCCVQQEGDANDWLKSQGLEVLRLHHNAPNAAFTEQLRRLQAEILIVDHYGVSKAEHDKYRPHVRTLVVLDDLANRELNCDVLIDTGLGKHAQDYAKRIPPNTKLLLGERYAILAEEFGQLQSSARQRRISQTLNSRLLVSLGSMDVKGLLPALVRELSLIDAFRQWQVRYVVSSRTPNLAEINKAVDMAENALLVMDTEDMAGEILAADFAIGAAGISAYERCALGLPSLIVPVADNQLHFAEQLEARGLAICEYEGPSWVHRIAARTVFQLSQAQTWVERSLHCMKQLDGQGAERLAKEIIVANG